MIKLLKNCKLIIFDWDGTLTDTNFLIVEEWVRKLRKYGIIIPRSTILDYVIKESSRDWPVKLIAQYNKKLTFDKLINTRVDCPLTPDYDKVFPSVPKLFDELKKRNIKIAVGTNGGEKWIRTLAKRNKINHLIDVVVGGADMGVSKPNPKIFSDILKKTGVSSNSTLVVGDSIVDIMSAKKLNIRCINFLTGGASYTDLKNAGSVKIYKDVSGFLDDIIHSKIS